MKQDWYPDELTQHWTLSAEERELLDSKTSATRLSFALLLKAFQFDGRFPDRREDIAGRIVTYVASQTGVPPAAYSEGEWSERTHLRSLSIEPPHRNGWAVSCALLNYLQEARPQTTARAVFVRMPAPHVPLRTGSSLYTLIRRLLEKAGITLEGKRGPHTFRHARAVSLLRAAVPVKTIGDVLGHRSAASTRPYLKLATEDLRAVGLEVPQGVKP